MKSLADRRTLPKPRRSAKPAKENLHAEEARRHDDEGKMTRCCPYPAVNHVTDFLRRMLPPSYDTILPTVRGRFYGARRLTVVECHASAFFPETARWGGG